MALDVPSGPMVLKPTFEDGVDMLWKFQLRKEHAALLKDQDANNKQLQQLTADAIKNKKNFDERMTALEEQTIKNKKEFDERMAALETTILNLASEERRDRDGFEKYGEELATLRSQMGGVMETLKAHDWQPTGGISFLLPPRLATYSLIAQTLASHTGVSSSRDGPVIAFEPPKTISLTTGSTKIDNMQPAPTSTKTSKHVQAPIPAPNTIAACRINNRAENISSETVGPMTRSRSRTRSHSAGDPTYNRPPIQAPAPASRTTVPTSARTVTAQTSTQLPRLYQGHNSYKRYLDKATAAFNSLPHPVDQKFEIEFVSLFIQGITTEDKRNNLIAELQQQHQSRRKKGGKVEILCEWKDVAEGMKAAGLLQAASRSVKPTQKDKAAGSRSQFKNESKGLLDS